MKTRQNYLNGECSHRDYYAQFVTSGIKEIVRQRIGIKVIKESIKKDENLNVISLAVWDSLAQWFKITPSNIGVQMKESGDFLTLAGSVCIFKEAVRQIAEE